MQNTYTIKCPRCGNWNAIITENLSKYHLRCKICNKNTKVTNRMGQPELQIMKAENVREAAKQVQQLNKKDNEGK